MAATGGDGLRSPPCHRLHGVNTCHCLTFDIAQFAVGGEDNKKHGAVLASSVEEVLPLVLAWQPQLVGAGVACSFVKAARVHVQFRSHAHMAAALKATRLLMQCGATSSVWDVEACGPRRHDRPEKLELSCSPSDGMPHAASDLPAAITHLLKNEMQLEFTSHWISSQYTAARVGTGYVVVNVLPRSISLVDLTETVERLNAAKHTLWGGVVHVHAPIMPSLARCKDCGKLGHEPNACPRYSGVALRLLFSAPVPYAMLLELVERMGARKESFLGHAALLLPHRKVTLLFDVDKSQVDVSARLKSLLEPVLWQYGRLMCDAPRIVDVQNRLKECAECGSSDKVHACRWPQIKLGQQLQRGGGMGQPKQQQGKPSLGSASAPASVVPAGDMMCRSWRRSCTCPRLARGDRCRYEHPATYVVPQSVCFNFRDTGSCSRGEACRFQHAAPQQQPMAAVPPSVPAAAAAAAAVVRAAATVAPAVVASVAAAAAARVDVPTAVPVPKKAARTPAASPARKGDSESRTAPTSARKRKATDSQLQGKPSPRAPNDPNSWGAQSDGEEEKQSASSSSSVAVAVSRQGSAPLSSLSALSSPLSNSATVQKKQRAGTVPSVQRNLGSDLSASVDSSGSKGSDSSGTAAAVAASPRRVSSSTRL